MSTPYLCYNFLILPDQPTVQESNVQPRVTPRPVPSYKQPEAPAKENEDEKFTCPFCDRDFIEEKNLYFHKKFQHKGKISYYLL